MSVTSKNKDKKEAVSVTETKEERARRLARERKRKQRASERSSKFKATSESKNIGHDSNQLKWAKRNGFYVLERSGDPKIRRIYLSQSLDKKTWDVSIRSTGSGGSGSHVNIVFHDEESARINYSEAVSGFTLGDQWRSIDDYYPQASKIIEGKASPVNQPTLGLLYAIHELRENGFKGGPAATKPMSQSARYQRMRIRRASFSVVGNEIVPGDAQDFRNSYGVWLGKIAAHSNSTAYYNHLEYYLKEAVRMLTSYPRIFSDYNFAISDIRMDLFKEVKSANLHIELSDGSSAGHLKERNKYAPIPIKNLNDMLDNIKWPSVFNTTILGLSTGLRVMELDKLCKDRKYWVLNKTHLNYNCTGIDVSKKLITKTSRKYSVTKLNNPEMSLVTRVILLHKFELGWNPENPFHIQSKTRKSVPAFTKWPQRHLRATCATNIVYCEALSTIEEGRATRDMAKDRLGHVNRQMVDDTYAPNVPTERNPKRYFGISSIKDDDGFEISRYSTLWDTYLLGKFISFYKKILSKEEYSAFRRLIRKEAERYQNESAPQDDFDGYEMNL
jgi:hypothetical protein